MAEDTAPLTDEELAEVVKAGIWAQGDDIAARAQHALDRLLAEVKRLRQRDADARLSGAG